MLLVDVLSCNQVCGFELQQLLGQEVRAVLNFIFQELSEAFVIAESLRNDTRVGQGQLVDQIAELETSAVFDGV